MLTDMARTLGQAGFASLRFDFRGRGESDDPAQGCTLESMADDLVRTSDELKRRSGAMQLVLVGICSGGNIAIGSLHRLRDVTGAFMLSVYPFSEADSFGRNTNRTAHFLVEYLRKACRLSTWKRLIRGELFFGKIASVLFGHYKKDSRRHDDQLKPEGGAPIDNLVAYPEVSVKMIYGEADPDYQASYEYFHQYSEGKQRPISFETIAGANHNFYSNQWKSRLKEDLVRFVQVVEEKNAPKST
jgi:alpha/beta superfamily hydrolase